LKKSRKESELNTVESQIRGLETRLKYNKSDLSATVSILLYIALFVQRIILLKKYMDTIFIVAKTNRGS